MLTRSVLMSLSLPALHFILLEAVSFIRVLVCSVMLVPMASIGPLLRILAVLMPITLTLVLPAILLRLTLVVGKLVIPFVALPARAEYWV